MADSNLPWDGSFLGRIQKSDIILENKIGKNKYISFNYILSSGKIINCEAQIKKTGNTHQCICDELKCLFDLEKNGTHYAYIGRGNNYNILIKPRYVYNTDKRKLEICEHDFRLGDLRDDDKRLNENVQHVARVLGLYVEVLGIKININNIILTMNNKQLIPISIDEGPICKLLGNNILPYNYKKRWYKKNNISIYDMAGSVFNINNDDDIEKVLSHIRSKCEKIIKRVDIQHIEYVDYILHRINNLFICMDNFDLIEDDYDFDSV